jgi:hypothetical protein
MKTPRLALALLFLFLPTLARADIVCVQQNACCGTAAAGGPSLTATNAFTGTNSFVDNNFSIVGSTDATKKIKFEVDTSVPTATTNTLTAPAASGTIALTNGSASVLTGNWNFQGGGGSIVSVGPGSYFGLDTINTGGGIAHIAIGTPGTTYLVTGSESNSWVMAEYFDTNFNWAHAQQPNPTFYWQSANQSTTQWGSAAHNQTDFVIASGAGDLKLTPAGHVNTPGTAPAVSACGVTPSVVAGSDQTGTLTTGSGGAMQSCTLTFAAAWSAIPKCFTNNQTSFVAIRAIPTTTTVTFDVSVAGTLASVTFDYYCSQGV